MVVALVVVDVVKGLLYPFIVCTFSGRGSLFANVFFVRFVVVV